MKTILSFPRIAFLALALGTAGVTATFAQTATTTPTTAPTCSGGGGHHHHHDSVLTADEKAQLKAARDKAFAADPSLQTEKAALKTQFETLKSQGDSATKDQWQALHQQKQAFETKFHNAEVTADPTVAPIITKLEAAHQHCHHST